MAEALKRFCDTHEKPEANIEKINTAGDKKKKKKKKYVILSSTSDSTSSDSEKTQHDKPKLKKKKAAAGNKPKQTDAKKKWDNDEISHLIDLYEARPCLWDVFCPEYHNREATSKAKGEIEDILHVSWKEIRSQISTLRSILGQNMKKKSMVKSGQGTSELFTPTWIFWDSLQFLVPVMLSRKSRDTMKKVELDDTDKMDGNDNDLDQDQDDYHRPATTLAAKNQTKKIQMESTKQELWKECIRVLKKPKEPTSSGSLRSSFGDYVAEKLSRFDAKTKAIAEKRISDVLFELEIQVPTDNLHPHTNESVLYPLSNVSADSVATSCYQPGTFDMGNTPISSLYRWPQHQSNTK